MKRITNLQIAEEMALYGRKNGAHQIQIAVNARNHFTAEIRNQAIEKLTQAESMRLTAKVIVDDKVATGSSLDFNKETLHRLIDNAIERAKLSSPDKYSALPEAQKIEISAESLKLYDPKILELSPETKIATAKKIEEIAMKDKRINLSSGTYFGSVEGEYALAGSNGFSGAYKFTHCMQGGSFQSGEGDNLYEDGWYDSSINYAGLISPEELAKKAVHRTTRLIGAKKIETQKLTIVLEPTMTARILGMLVQTLSGRAVFMKQSLFAEHLGEKVGSDLVNIYDDATKPYALGSKPFDAEGVPTRKNNIISNGVLNQYLLDVYSARKLNLQPTGNASGANNLYLTAGNNSPEEIIKSVKRGFLLVSTIGQGFVPITGDLSTGAYGLLIENGELTEPIAEVTISGNLGNMLKDIEMVGNDQDFKRQISGPTIKIREMTISGK